MSHFSELHKKRLSIRKTQRIFNLVSAGFLLVMTTILLFTVSRTVVTVDSTIIQILDFTFLSLMVLQFVFRIYSQRSPVLFFRKNLLNLVLFIAYLLVFHLTPSDLHSLPVIKQIIPVPVLLRALILLRLALLLIKLLATAGYVRDFFTTISRNPAQTVIAGFMTVILVGALFLTLPIALKDGKTLSFLDALFTSTSAVCVTGLIVVDTGSHFTLFGQTVILLLIQAGGLGIMTLAVFIGLLIKDSLSLRERRISGSVFEQTNYRSPFKLIRQIVLITLVIEGAGTLLLYGYHQLITPLPASQSSPPLFYALFHTVSAFCNAGFSLNADNLVLYAGSPLPLLLFSLLIISGGLGFTVIVNLRNTFITRRSYSFFHRHYNPRGERLTLHTRIVLTVTAVLLIAGTVFFLIGEHNLTMQHLTPTEKVLNSFFQSTSTRTAGFNSVDFSALQPATLFFIILLMFIGASPGSTGGGIKTTTFAVLILTIRSLLQERKEVDTGRRVIPADVVNKAIAIFMLFLGMVVAATLLILLIENRFSFEQVLFEVVSASATVGLSSGITAQLSEPSRIVIICTMFLGRIGPLTLVMGMSLRNGRRRYIKNPVERVIIG